MPMSRNKKIPMMLAKGRGRPVGHRRRPARQQAWRAFGREGDARARPDVRRRELDGRRRDRRPALPQRGTRAERGVPAARHGGAGRAQEEEPEAAGQALLDRVPRAGRIRTEARLRLSDVLRDARRCRREDGRRRALRPRGRSRMLHRPGWRRRLPHGQAAWHQGRGARAGRRAPVLGQAPGGGFCDMGRKPWREGRMRAFEGFGGVPRMRAQTTPPRRPAGPVPRASRSRTRSTGGSPSAAARPSSPRGSGSRAMRALPNQPSTR